MKEVPCVKAGMSSEDGALVPFIETLKNHCLAGG